MQWILLILAALPAAGQALVPAVCAGCHNSLNAMGGLDLAALPRRFEDRSVRERWIRVYDRVVKGEMPPKGVAFSAAQRAAMLDPLRRAIYEADHAEVVRDGRGSLRRLNRDEYEQNLRDVLKLPDLDIRDMLPEDREGHRFNKAAETLDMSRTVNRGAALAIAFMGLRYRMSAKRAYELGFVTELVPPDQLLPRAMEIAKTIVEYSAPLAVQGAKANIWQGFNMPTDQAMVYTRIFLNQVRFQTEDAKEGPKAFVEKRKPVWLGR